MLMKVLIVRMMLIMTMALNMLVLTKVHTLTLCIDDDDDDNVDSDYYDDNDDDDDDDDGF